MLETSPPPLIWLVENVKSALDLGTPFSSRFTGAITLARAAQRGISSLQTHAQPLWEPSGGRGSAWHARVRLPVGARDDGRVAKSASAETAFRVRDASPGS